MRDLEVLELSTSGEFEVTRSQKSLPKQQLARSRVFHPQVIPRALSIFRLASKVGSFNREPRLQGG
jgi:hypothetical protein